MNFDILNKITTCIKNGGVIAYPTEAVFGVGCDPRNINAIGHILEIKKRDPNKGLILVASSIEQLHGFVDFSKLNENHLRKMDDIWPGPYTLILPAHDSIKGILTGYRDTIAVRVSAFKTIIEICNAMNSPIVSTSCNESGQNPLTIYEDVCTNFKDKLDYIVNERVGNLSKPTQIIDLLSDKVLR